MSDWDRILNQKSISEEYNINPPNFMDQNEAICFMYNSLFQQQTKILEKLENIEKMLEER